VDRQSRPAAEHVSRPVALFGKADRSNPFHSTGVLGQQRAADALLGEMCDFGLDGLSAGRSPDRLDALVWAITALNFGARGEPRIRAL
jgi:phage terminase large subunit-like protein